MLPSRCSRLLEPIVTQWSALTCSKTGAVVNLDTCILSPFIDCNVFMVKLSAFFQFFLGNIVALLYVGATKNVARLETWADQTDPAVIQH